ncbi:dTDP-4-dehydrorhamnose 3,5-epimerase [Puia dinghuensis]|uniref:dTDP-4-dehydrorhamnose 3,5-epimerase n=1 Tax=Puia dinghuensis TaxID=1792502 RepID=A0A8J2U8M3_9BACT|nr:dTDP-4-dehydrorhamnose 3,5-epimerase [Puia dinghuensis]GGA86336.1 dTDP-4-dehydrorhamnose 3,5-epimerase [Puia dinghuensis]
MIFTATRLTGAFVIELQPYTDERGWFARFYCKNEFGQHIGHTKEWVQLNHSISYRKGTIRGMHFQHPPYREIKMVRCIAGAVFDVIVDLRRDSPTFLQWTGVELSATNNRMLYIPEGFAHGFQTLEENSALLYHHTEYYTPEAEGGFRHDDPAFAIEWPLSVSSISARDSGHPFVDNNFKGI